MKILFSSCWKFLRFKQSRLGALKFKSSLPKAYSSEEVRSTFISFFNRKYDHTHIPSSKVYSSVDDSLLFVNAGMNQFKPILLGTSDSHEQFGVVHRAVNSQRCIRVGGKHNDLDVVGQDCYHHTLFEMLGSWSFGDYFKKDACKMAWELLTNVFQLPKENLYVTYFGGCKEINVEPDLETKEIWLSVGVPEDRIFPFGPEFNFWEMGDFGPCGPCTEIHYDQIGNRYVPDAVNVDGSDVIEIWNLVFTQYNRISPNQLELLEKFHVDTGMGLERITTILQGKSSNYDTDLFQPIIAKLESMADCRPYGGNVGAADQNGIDTAYRIISDHIRMITIAIADGVLPGPREKDMIVRRVLRRAVKFGSEYLNLPHLFLGKLVPVVIEKLKNMHPNLTEKQSHIIDIIDHAEQEYYHLITKGDSIVNKTVLSMTESDKFFPTQTAIYLLSNLGYPRDRFFQQLQYNNKVINTSKVDKFFQEKHSKSSQDVVNGPIKDQQLEQIFLQSLSALKLKKTVVLQPQFERANERLIFESIPVDVLMIFDKNGKVVLNNEVNDDHVYLVFDKTCFFHPHSHSLFSSVGEVKFSSEVVGTVDEVLNVQNWVLHRISPKHDCFELISVGSVVNLCTISDQWLSHLRAFDAAVIFRKVLGDVASGNDIQTIKYEPDKLKIELSGVINPDTVLKLEEAVNDVISDLSYDKLSPELDKYIENAATNLLPQDIIKFVVVAHKLQGKSRTVLRCVTGNRASLCKSVAENFQISLDSVTCQYKELAHDDIQAVNNLISLTGTLTYDVNKSEINFATKAEYRKYLRSFSGKLNTLHRKLTKQN